MAGIKCTQHEVFKIETNRLKYYKWDLTISKKEAIILEELIPLFDSQSFRIIYNKLLNVDEKDNTDWTKYIFCLEVNNKADFKRATNKKGFKVNGVSFKRCLGTTGGLKGNTVIFINNEIYDKFNTLIDCKRNKNIPFIPAKLEAYKSLSFSSSQEILSPNKILVVKDCITKYTDDVINLDDSDETLDEPKLTLLKNVELENNASDGYNLCTIEFMKKVSKKLELDYIASGVCLRNAWLKGMMYAFPIIEFIDKYNNGNYYIDDIWGNTIDIREVELILTESSLKLWMCYDSIEDYMSAYKDCGFEFAVTKISPNILEDNRELNYQYLQSYDFNDKDIEELCESTVKYLKNSLCGDYQQTINFLGISGNLHDNSWQQALNTNEYMLNDPYIIDLVYRMIKKKINNAKIGKLICNGNYQIASGDPFALMQSICGLKVTGLLKANEVYSKYWLDKNVNEIVIFRSPMTSHNNIRKCNVVQNDEINYWYQYMNTIMIINAWDSFCMAENGCDYDSDILYSSNNNVLLRKYRKLPAIQCIQRKAQKVIVTEKDIIQSNLNGMGNKVGEITNRVTSMMEVQSRFDKNSQEYKVLDFRIACGQLYQQNELDKIKGIVAKKMPKSWYNIHNCEGNDFLQSICANKKPYFFIYIYDDVRRTYKNYIESNNKKCRRLFFCELNDLLNMNNNDLSNEQKEFIQYYYKYMPVGLGSCSMNKICWYIEKQFDGYKRQLKHNNEFDYNILKVKRRCTEKHRKELYELSQEYITSIATYKNNKKISWEIKLLQQI